MAEKSGMHENVKKSFSAVPMRQSEDEEEVAVVAAEQAVIDIFIKVLLVFVLLVKENNILDEDDLPDNVEEIYEIPAEKATLDLPDLDDELDTADVNDANEKDTSISAGPVNVDTTEKKESPKTP
ncbi:unnamed protein product, partial [Didymodactylos carnosus]